MKLTKDTVTIMHNDDDQDRMQGEITGNNCSWKIPYREGKTTFTTKFIDAWGEINPAQVSIEGKDGKTVVLLDIIFFGKTLRFTADRYEGEENQ